MTQSSPIEFMSSTMCMSFRCHQASAVPIVDGSQQGNMCTIGEKVEGNLMRHMSTPIYRYGSQLCHDSLTLFTYGLYLLHSLQYCQVSYSSDGSLTLCVLKCHLYD